LAKEPQALLLGLMMVVVVEEAFLWRYRRRFAVTPL
jgi:hypothetical protein